VVRRTRSDMGDGEALGVVKTLGLASAVGVELTLLEWWAGRGREGWWWFVGDGG
jgi:hypothetical protein